MKPEQFIREYGVDKAREVVEGAPGFPVFGYCTLTGNYIFKRSNATAYYHNETNSWSEDYAIELILLEDLKRLVESLDLVVFLGGIDGLNVLLDMANSPFALSGVTRDGVFYSSEKIKEIVAVHESIYGGGDES
ncbi:hypothetical protein ACLDYA_16050 [Acinetobacter baumannii]